LLGRKFKLVTDWLSSQKIEGLLARWALVTQQYNFTITYRRGVENGNADALSRHAGIDLTATVSYLSSFSAELKHHQQKDSLVCQLKDALQPPKALPSDQSWYQPPLRRYRQL